MSLEIIFTPETPEQREKSSASPWWKAEHIKEARQLIAAEAERRGEVPPSPTSGAGSGWWIELPRYVAILIGEQGMERAAEYVAWVFDQETSADAFDKIMALNPDENFCVASWGE